MHLSQLVEQKVVQLQLPESMGQDAEHVSDNTQGYEHALREVLDDVKRHWADG
jgi:hypothetical protein